MNVTWKRVVWPKKSQITQVCFCEVNERTASERDRISINRKRNYCTRCLHTTGFESIVTGLNVMRISVLAHIILKLPLNFSYLCIKLVKPRTPFALLFECRLRSRRKKRQTNFVLQIQRAQNGRTVNSAVRRVALM